MKLFGTLRLSTEETCRTVGMFNKLVEDNARRFRHYFGVDIFPGSLNVDVPDPPSLQEDLDAGRLTPSLVIPRSELVNMPDYIGDGQAWRCKLHGEKFPGPISCWIFRRIGSRVPPGVIEIIAQAKLREPYGLSHGDSVIIQIDAG